jgi:hypothetical protein
VFTNQHRKQFEEYATLLRYLVGKSKTTYKQRMAKVSQITESYIQTTGIRPEPAQLDCLSALILYDDVMNPDSHKIKHNEYPILSDLQMDRRKYGGRGEGSNMGGETSISEAEHVGADGRDYRYPNRRKRTIGELIYVDENARIRNKLRAAQYRKDTAPGPLVTYNLRENGGELAPDFVACIGIGQRWKDEMSAVNETEIVREDGVWETLRSAA